MKLSKEEIEKRITEVSGKFECLKNIPRKERYFKYDESVAELEGELFGLNWVLKFWDSGYYEA